MVRRVIRRLLFLPPAGCALKDVRSFHATPPSFFFPPTGSERMFRAGLPFFPFFTHAGDEKRGRNLRLRRRNLSSLVHERYVEYFRICQVRLVDHSIFPFPSLRNEQRKEEA